MNVDYLRVENRQIEENSIFQEIHHPKSRQSMCNYDVSTL